MYVLYLEPDGSVGVRSSHAENWRCGFIYVLEGEKKNLANKILPVFENTGAGNAET